MRPEIIVADEPTAGLDVSVQGELLNLLLDLQREFGLTYLLVSHNLNVIRRVTGRTAVMYLGQIVEEAATRDLFAKPAHPYSAALLSTNPAVDPRKRVQPIVLQGEIPSAVNPPGGCRFHTRCPVAQPTVLDRPAFAAATRGRATRALPFPVLARSTAALTATTGSCMPSIDLTYLNGPDVAALALTDDEILAAVEGGLRAQGLGQTVHRAARAPRAGELRQGSLQRAARRRRDRSASPASRSSAISSTTGNRACRPSSRC